MKKLVLITCAIIALIPAAFAGSDYNKNVIQEQSTTAFYGEKEVNVDLFESYAFKSNGLHAAGGGADVKYFFTRNLGVGVEGFALTNGSSKHAAVLGTATLRFPIQSSRFAPYVYGGVGTSFAGFNKDNARLTGQVGGGIETRITPRVGVITDVNYNIVGGRRENFGMTRVGVNFVF